MLILAITVAIACYILHEKKKHEDWLVGGALLGFFLTIIISGLINGLIPTEKVLSHTENLQPFYDRATGQGPFLLEGEDGTYLWRSDNKERTCDARFVDLTLQEGDTAQIETYVITMKPFWRLIVFPAELGMPQLVYKIHIDYEKINFIFKKPH